MEELAKLPKAYYKYANIDLNDNDKNIQDKVVITISLFVACKIEKFLYQDNLTNQRFLQQLLLNSKILNEADLDLKETKKYKFEFENIEPETLRNVKANKQINIYLSKYAKEKLYKELVKKGYELTFLIKKELIKLGVITIEDLSY